TGIPRAVPPVALTDGNSGCPRALSELLRTAAFDSDIRSTAEETERPAAVIWPISAAMSVRPFAGDVPADVIGVTPLVTEPGDTFAAAALVGSVNSTSRKYAMPLIMSLRITCSASGVEFRAS